MGALWITGRNPSSEFARQQLFRLDLDTGAIAQYTRDILVDDVVARGTDVYVSAYVPADETLRVWRVGDDGRLAPVEAARGRSAGRIAVLEDGLAWAEDDRMAGIGPDVPRRRLVRWRHGDTDPDVLFEGADGVLGPVAGPSSLWVTTGRSLARGHRAGDLVELDASGVELRRFALPELHWDMQPRVASSRHVVVSGRFGSDPDQARTTSLLFDLTSGAIQQLNDWTFVALTEEGTFYMTHVHGVNQTVLIAMNPGQSHRTIGIVPIPWVPRAAIANFEPSGPPYATLRLDTSTDVQFATSSASVRHEQHSVAPTVEARRGLTVEPNVFEDLHLGALEIKGEGAGALLEQVIVALLAVRHPEEPSDPFASYVSPIEAEADVARCTFDLPDLSAYPEVRAQMFDAIMTTANRTTGVFTISVDA